MTITCITHLIEVPAAPVEIGEYAAECLREAGLEGAYVAGVCPHGCEVHAVRSAAH